MTSDVGYFAIPVTVGDVEHRWRRTPARDRIRCSRFYKLLVVDTGNNVRAANWQAAIDATDQLVVTISARNDSAETAARMLDHLE